MGENQMLQRRSLFLCFIPLLVLLGCSGGLENSTETDIDSEIPVASRVQVTLKAMKDVDES